MGPQSSHQRACPGLHHTWLQQFPPQHPGAQCLCREEFLDLEFSGGPLWTTFMVHTRAAYDLIIHQSWDFHVNHFLLRVSGKTFLWWENSTSLLQKIPLTCLCSQPTWSAHYCITGPHPAAHLLHSFNQCFSVLSIIDLLCTWGPSPGIQYQPPLIGMHGNKW